jgi:hypothetical protein
MTTTLTVTVQNQTPYQQVFYLFQQPATYTGEAIVYSSSLSSGPLNGGSSGEQLTFKIYTNYYAAVQQTPTLTPTVGSPPSGWGTAHTIISLAANNNTPAENDSTTMNIAFPNAGVYGVSLSMPVNDPSVPAGAFRIVTAQYNPASTFFNIGLLTEVAVNNLIQYSLSSFILGAPDTSVDCQPIQKFYVQIGNYTSGTVLPFTSSTNAAVCDFTGGDTSIFVVYNADGTWTVSSGS